MIKNRNTIVVVFMVVLVFTLGALLPSCVSQSKYSALYSSKTYSDSISTSRIDELKEQLKLLNNERIALLADTIKISTKLDNQRMLYRKLLENNSLEISKMMRQLEDSQIELDKKIKRISALESTINDYEVRLTSVVATLSNAMLPFKDKGIAVTRQDGKIYISVDDALLFKPGSFNIDANATKAIGDVALFLEQNPDIEVMVEGHTDSMPYPESGNLSDNWDLSAKRATQVVRELLKNKKIAPRRITAAGRAEYMPLSSNATPEDRARNRRIEIILTPKLDEIYKIILQQTYN